jgi:ribonucleotide monophosphatase NagD (HAD superfamily)
MTTLTLSPLGHTWLLDLDGTLVRHNGHKIDGYDTFLDGAEVFLKNISEADMVIFITSRTEAYREQTERFLAEHGIRYEHIIFNAPLGERILVNDRKPSGLNTAAAVNVKRDGLDGIRIEVDEKL